MQIHIFVIPLHLKPFICIYVYVYVYVYTHTWVCIQVISVLSCIWLFAAAWTVAHQAPLSMEFSRQEYWSRLPFPTLGDLLDPGI